MAKIVRFSYEKDTKGTYVYREVDKNGDDLEIVDSVIGKLYLRKDKFGEKPPKKIKVKIMLPEDL